VIAFVKPTLDGFLAALRAETPCCDCDVGRLRVCLYGRHVPARGVSDGPVRRVHWDFNGDGQPDMALLMKRQRDGRILPVVFRSQGGRYEVTLIDHITDPYGFNENATCGLGRSANRNLRTESSSQKWEARRPSWAIFSLSGGSRISGAWMPTASLPSSRVTSVRDGGGDRQGIRFSA